MSRPGFKQLKFLVSIISFLLCCGFALEVFSAFAADKQQPQENLNGKVDRCHNQEDSNYKESMRHGYEFPRSRHLSTASLAYISSNP
jgi:hypothetical protein